MTPHRHLPGPIVRIRQRGGDKSTHPCLTEVTRFFLQGLLPDLAPQLRVQLVLCGPGTLGPRTAGLVRMPDSCPAPVRNFMVLVDRRDVLPVQVRTLAHECIHVQQFALGRLGYAGGRVLWDGADAGPLREADDYDERARPPWEVDAWTREEELAVSAWPVIQDHLRPTRQNSRRRATAVP